MLLSLKWLREFVPYTGTAEELGQRLTMLGLELEEILRPYDAIESIRIGHILTCVKHPEADKLSVCTVDMGDAEPLNIVCGAPNVGQGQKVPVALVGTVMPDGMRIKKAKLRGQASHGMICSERELGLTEDHSGIMVLPDDAPVGQALVEYLDLDREVLNIGITPNRADCLSVLGLAREVALAYNLPLTLPSCTIEEHGEDISTSVPIEINDAEQCWLYQGRIIENVHIGPSPMHIRHRLHAVGIRPISNIVDVTNYILMECGQPLHAFDRDKIRGGRITIATASADEKVTTLDGQERVLTANDITIRDTIGPVALAGVMGGLESEITESSSRVFLESAVFRPASIRKTARRLGLSSESSFRFERGVDQIGNTFAMNRAAAMMASLSGGNVCRGVCRQEPRPWQAPSMIFRLSRANALLGLTLEEDFCYTVLTGIGCSVDKTGTKDTATWQVTAPSWRYDLEREADLIEEVGRVYGLDRIAPVLPTVTKQLDRAGAPMSVFSFWSRIKHWGHGLGLNEAVNYSFVGHKDLDFFHLPTEARVSIVNPLSAEQDALRTALAPGLLQNVRHNLAQGATGLRLFELAHIFKADATSETTVTEYGRMGILLYGTRFDGAWPQTNADVDYSDIKGIVEHLLASLHLQGAVFSAQVGHPYLLPSVAISLAGQEIGVIGRVKPSIATAFHAKKDLWLAELDTDALYHCSTKAQIAFTPLPIYPPVRRDITIMGDMALNVQTVLNHVQALSLPLLKQIILIDHFEPQDGMRNLTFRLTFRHAERTLQDKEVDKEREKIAQSLTNTLGVRI